MNDAGIDLPPAPQVSEQARLIVVAVGYWLALCLIVAMVGCTRAYVTHASPDAPHACMVAPMHECTIDEPAGRYTLYAGYNGIIGIASPTAKAGTP